MHTLTPRGGSKGYVGLPVCGARTNSVPIKTSTDAYPGVWGRGPGTPEALLPDVLPPPNRPNPVCRPRRIDKRYGARTRRLKGSAFI